MNLVVGIMLWSRNTFQMDKPKLSMQTMPLKSLTFDYSLGKGHKAFLPFSTSPPKFPLKKIREEAKSIKTCQSAPHTVKGFADDITIISPSVPAHNCALKETDKKVSSLDLRLKPENACHFFLMERILPKSPLSTVLLSHGSTRNISEGAWTPAKQSLQPAPAKHQPRS